MVEINLNIFAAQLVTFLIAVFILWKIAWGPLYGILGARREKIKNELELIEQTKQRIKQLEAEYAQRLEQIHSQAEAIIKQSREAASSEREKILQSAAQDAESLRAKAKLQIQGDQARLLQELISEIFSLSLEMTEKLLQRSVDRNAQEEFFRKSLAELNGSLVPTGARL